MAIQTALKTGHGRGTVDFTSEIQSSDLDPIHAWGAALDSFDLRFGADGALAGGHPVRGLSAMVKAAQFARPNSLSAVFGSGLTDDNADPSTTKLGIVGITSDRSDSLYLFTAPPVYAGPTSHTFPGTVSVGAVGLAGLDVSSPLTKGSLDVRAISSLVSGGIVTNTTSITPDVQIAIGDNSGYFCMGNASLLYVGIPSGSTIPAPKTTAWALTQPPVSVSFQGLPARTKATALVLITSFTITYGSAQHNLSEVSLTAGNENVVIGWQQQNNGTWTATVSFLPSMSMSDGAGNTASTVSNVSLCIFLLPA